MVDEHTDAPHPAENGGGCMASVTDSEHLCSLDCVPIFCPFSDDNRCPAGLEFCPSMHQRMCVTDEPEEGL